MLDQGIKALAKEWKTDCKNGLTEEEALKRRREFGKNQLKAAKKRSLPEAFFAQLQDPLIYVLAVAAGISILLGEKGDALIIGVVVGLNACVGVLQEGKARKALDSLKELASPRALVCRDGEKRMVEAWELVPGDVVFLEAGCQVPADLKLTETVNLKIEEAVLTGEAYPVEKKGLKDRAYMSTLVTAGRGEGIVTDVGMDTEIGRIAALLDTQKEELTPLQKRLGELGKVLSMLSLLLCGGLFVLAVLQKRNIPDMLITAISLAVAAVPEGLPAVVTICLALSVTRMVKVHAIVRKLPSVETLGAVNVVCTDKTGTLTRNRMTVEEYWLPGQKEEDMLCREELLPFLRGMALCNDAFLGKDKAMGDPTETALLYLARSFGVEKDREEENFPRCREISFDSERKMMSTLHRTKDHSLVLYAKGAPERILEKCAYVREKERNLPMTERFREEIREKVRQMSEEGLRTLAVSEKLLEEGRGELAAAEWEGNSFAEESGKGSRKSWSSVKSTSDRRSSADRKDSRDNWNGVDSGKGRDRRSITDSGNNMDNRLEQNLVFLGIAGMRDPLRPEAKEAVRQFQTAGVKTVMITGDHLDTAFAIAKALGIAKKKEECMTGAELAEWEDVRKEGRREGQREREYREGPREKEKEGTKEEHSKGRGELDNIRVFARVSPAQKVNIVNALKETGNIVAMTGDGVNDAPALKAADIGIAMGKGGTDVARQAADMILTDDNFATIERAIEEGRGVYENIRKSVIFLLSSNLGELLTMFLAVLCRISTPLKSSHILWINLITDSLPALALGMDPADGKSLMRCPPRKAGESLFARGGLACTCFYGALITAISLTAFFSPVLEYLRGNALEISLGQIREALLDTELLARAQTYAFTVLGMSQLYHAVGMKDTQKSVLFMKHWLNPMMLVACVIGFLLQFAVTEIPFLIEGFGTVSLTGREWLRLSILSAFPILAHECIVISGKIFGRKDE